MTKGQWCCGTGSDNRKRSSLMQPPQQHPHSSTTIQPVMTTIHPQSTSPLTVSPVLADILAQSSQRFDELITEIEAVDQRPIQTTVEVLSSLAPGVLFSHISTLERWSLEWGFEEAEQMKRGRELDIFGPPPPAIDEILQQVESAISIQQSQPTQPTQILTPQIQAWMNTLSQQQQQHQQPLHQQQSVSQSK